MNLIDVAPNLWVATQPLRFFGLEIGSRMTLIRLPSQQLIMISPISLQKSDVRKIEALGSLQHIIAPNLFHHLSLAEAKALFPQAKTWGVPGLAQKRPDFKIDTILDQAGDFESSLHYLPIQGFATLIPPSIQLANEVVFFHAPTQTLIVTDIAFHFDEHSDRLIQALSKAIGSYQMLRPTFLEKWSTRNKQTVERSIRNVLAWDFKRVIPGHGSILESNAKTQFKNGFEWFLDKSLD